MRAITLHQPWASLIAAAAKQVETRGWPTSYRGPLMIHAAKQIPSSYRPFANDMFRDALEGLCDVNEFGAPVIDQLPTGCVLAVVELEDCRPITPWGDVPNYALSEEDRAFGNFSNAEGQRYGWILRDIKPLAEPVYCRGRQRLWVPDAETVISVCGRMRLPITP